MVQKLSAFQSRFRPKFDPVTKVYVATKKILLTEKGIFPGELFFVDEIKLPVRKIRLLLELRYMDPLPKDEAEKALAERERSREQFFKELVDKAVEDKNSQEVLAEKVG